RWRVDPIEVPVCEACRPHVARSTTGAQLAGIGICVAAGGILWGATQGLTPVAVGAAVLLAAIRVWLLRRRARRHDRACDGHHEQLEIGASPGQCAIRTTNRRLAEELIRRNRERLFRVR